MKKKILKKGCHSGFLKHNLQTRLCEVPQLMKEGCHLSSWLEHFSVLLARLHMRTRCLSKASFRLRENVQFIVDLSSPASLWEILRIYITIHFNTMYL